MRERKTGIINFRIDGAVKTRFHQLAELQNKGISDLLREAIDDMLDENESQKQIDEFNS